MEGLLPEVILEQILVEFDLVLFELDQLLVLLNPLLRLTLLELRHVVHALSQGQDLLLVVLEHDLLHLDAVH